MATGCDWCRMKGKCKKKGNKKERRNCPYHSNGGKR